MKVEYLNLLEHYHFRSSFACQQRYLLTLANFEAMPHTRAKYASLLACSWLARLSSCASPRHFAASFFGENLITRQAQPLPECHFEHRTDVWTSCQDFLWTFNLTLDYFRIVNPEISSSCDNYVAGNTYCVLRGESRLSRTPSCR